MLPLAVLVAALVAAGCGSNGDGPKTVTVERQATPSKPPAPRKHRNPVPKPKPPPTTTDEAGLTACDQNIRVKADTTTCPFAENVFWTYYMSGQSSALRVWSPAGRGTYDTTCESEGSEVLCTTDQGALLKFSQAAVDAYSKQADAYSRGHDLGPDPYEDLPRVDTAPPPETHEPPDTYEPPETSDRPPSRGNIPNYENGRGYRVRCADGMYSHSGGIQGACSHHGGVAP